MLFTQRISICLLLILLFQLTLVEAKPIRTSLKNVVTFIYIKHNDEKIANGTGFFIGVESSKFPGKYYLYLATAKHVLLLDEKKNIPFDSVYLRINKTTTGTDYLPISLKFSGPNKNVFTHSDPSVDLAVIPISPPNENQFDYGWFSTKMIANIEDFKKFDIREGSEVFFIGMFHPQNNDDKNHPIVRFGKIAMLPDQIDNAELYLMECFVFPGNSGSPVFFNLGADYLSVGGMPEELLGGIVKSEWLASLQFIPAATNEQKLFPAENMGISEVIPSHLLQEILLEPELKHNRDFNDQIYPKGLPTLSP